MPTFDDASSPRPPEGDWLGTKFLKFTREGPFGIVTLDRAVGGCDPRRPLSERGAVSEPPGARRARSPARPRLSVRLPKD